jgi:cell division septation protein DedD
VVPLPAQNVLEATPIVTRPRDALTRAATEGAQLTPASIVSNDDKTGGDAKADKADKADKPAMSPAGREGGYQLQVSSFRTQAEADQFATQLRARTHKAYVVEAHVPGRGTWYRVRIGPFTSHHAAAQYRSGFEGREHVVPFIVPPTQK